MSLALARAMIAPMLPPSEWETYQTHIPWRSKAVLLTLPPVSTCPAPPVSAEAAGANTEAITTATTITSANAPRLQVWVRWLTTGSNTVEVEALRAASDRPCRLNIPSLPQVPTRYRLISPTRKILCAAALLLGAIACAPTSALGSELHQISGPPARKFDAVRKREVGPELQHAGLAQKGRELILTVRTSEPVGLGKLEPHPDPRRADARYLCFEISSDPSAPPQRYCLGGPKGHRRIGLELVNPIGKPGRELWVRATVKRPQAAEARRRDRPTGSRALARSLSLAGDPQLRLRGARPLRRIPACHRHQ